MAADSVSVDALLADAVKKLDALSSRMDALETGPGSKNPIKGDDDDDKKDDSKRGDSKRAAADDDDDDDRRDSTNRHDDDDDDDKKDDAAGGTAPKTKILDAAKSASKGDAAKSSSKVDDGELEIKHKGKPSERGDKEKADAARGTGKADDDDDDKKDDAFPPPKKPVKDDDDDDKKDDAIKSDAVADLRRQIADQKATIARLEAKMTPRSDDEHAAFADAQARADAVFNGFGLRAPRPLEGEGLIDYRRRLATKLKSHSKQWKDVKLSQLPEQAFGIAEGQIYSDAETAAANPVDLGAGELRMVTKIDPTTGVRSNVFYGKESFVKNMGRPGRRVAAFRTLASQ